MEAQEAKEPVTNQTPHRLDMQDWTPPNIPTANKSNVNSVNSPDKSAKSTVSNNMSDIKKPKAKNWYHYLYLGQRRISPSKAKGSHPAYIILKRLQATEPKKLKDIMPRKMLLRAFYQVYQERGLFDLDTVSQNVTT